MTDLCPFCHPEDRPIVLRNDLAVAFYDKYPVSPGHLLVIPIRHVASWFDATPEEKRAIDDLVDQGKALLDQASTTSSYKYAVLLSLMDLVLEKTDQKGLPPEAVIPWSRQPNDGLANLVLADKKCNRKKRAYLASCDHVAAWLKRNGDPSSKDDLKEIARRYRWELGLESSLGVASSIYLHLRPKMVLWKQEEDFEFVEESTLSMLESMFQSVEVA